MILGIVFPPSILLLDFRIGDEATYHSSKENEETKDKEDDNKSSKVIVTEHLYSNSNTVGLCVRLSEYNHCVFQDGVSNVDAMSKKGDEEESHKKQRRVPMGKKIYEFYNAPFTKFWFNTASRNL